LELSEQIYPLLQRKYPNPWPKHPGMTDCASVGEYYLGVNLYCAWGSGFPTALGPIYLSDDIANRYPDGQILIDGDGVCVLFFLKKEI
jgi:hypothetical protein